jgi:acylphosphatase
LIIARRFLVHGQVQGVGFRFFAEDVARRDGLVGFVRNLTDGSVEVVAEGEDEAVSRFERSLYSGPLLARVENVEVKERLPDGSMTSFRIRA